MRPVAVLLVATAVIALPRLIYHYEPDGATEAIESNPVTEYNNTWAPSNGSATSNGTYTPPGNWTNIASVGFNYGRCGSDFGNCESGSCCSHYGYCGIQEPYCGDRNSTKFQNLGILYPPHSNTSIHKREMGPTRSIIPRRKVGSVPYAGSGEIRHCTEMGTVALTFDDGPSAYTDDLLDLLDEYGAKATFFITGNNNGVHEIDDCSTGYPAIIKRMYDSGHQIASHTWGHPDLSGVDEEEFDRQMYRNEMAIRNILGVIPTYMRPPYISCDYTCAQKLDDMGYHNIYFDVDTVDYWNNDAELIHNAMDNVDAAISAKGWDPSQGSFLILQHDIHYHSVYSLTEYILNRMAEAGYGTSVTVGTCLGDPPRNWYRDAQPATVEC
ncbi:hypothetical protein V496_04611 [Pseudogymnoascus sp. VKM F-4515 (FW-2607)]|nr:hypothetical protein V496_04611 [Pseudogymnoascus sp. VKM F-4515 (FW-2607)]KFY96048.1 hypothetical protein V498_02937 [Pseudogymnoascus sp. VKM F-4517 (FW-2822)]